MSHIRLSEQARLDLIRLYEFLEKYDKTIADRSNAVIITAFETLETLPKSCPLLPNRRDLRKLVIHFGQSGYVAFYNYNEITDTCTITKINHQREKYNSKEL